MPRKPPGSRFRLLLVLSVVLALVLAACGNSDDKDDASGGSDTTAASGTTGGSTTKVDAPGVTDTEIRFSSFGTNSNNPLGTCVLTCYDQGIKAYFAFRNSQGGVHGRKLVLAKELDDELSKNKVRALEITTANDTFAAFSAAQIADGYATIAQAGMPLFLWNIQPEAAGQQSMFPHGGNNCFNCTTRTAAYVAKLAKAKKIATLGYGVSENSKKCAAFTADSIEKYSAEIGGTTVAYTNGDLPFGLPNGVGPEVTAMKKAGVDFVFTCLDLNGDKTIANELARQGMADVHMWHPNMYDADFVKNAGDLFEGDYVGVQFRPFEASSGKSALGDFKTWMGKQNAKITEMAMVGWINADEAYTGIKAAGPSFDRAKVIAALNKVTDYTAGGLINAVDWSRQHEPPTEADPASHGYAKDCFAIVQIKSGTFHVVGDAAKPWQCWPGDTRAWSDPTPTDFS